jgi:hypothetical protein
MDFSELETQIPAYPDCVHGNGATPSEIAAAEAALKTQFVGGFRSLLERFGWLAVEGFEIYGIGAGVLCERSTVRTINRTENADLQGTRVAERI